MVLSRDWLWDRKISIKRAKGILANPQNEHFLNISSILLSRKNTPKEIFKHYLKQRDFVVNWNRIKRQMRKNAWNDPRIEYWQAIYEKLREKDKFKRVRIYQVNKVVKPGHLFFKEIAGKIKTTRKQKGISQKLLAKKLKVSQQVISRIESGEENMSLNTLNKIANGLGARLSVNILV